MGLYLLDYGAGNVQSLANSLKGLGHKFTWISSPQDFKNASMLIFPGVGAFGTAVDHLAKRGLLRPLQAYIKSGKPYFGICVGMQILFQVSAESPGRAGLGIIPCPIERFDDSEKVVPHMGWNATEFVEKADVASCEGMDDLEHYYFVHSYRAAYDPETYPEAAQWAHTTCQYGQEMFMASVRRGNVFGTQFHPEKSGTPGLTILDTWIKSSAKNRAIAPSSLRIPRLPRPFDRFTKRIIACMDVRANDDGDLVVTKGDQYNVREKVITSKTAGAVRNLGKPVVLAAAYYRFGADELCLLNITSFRHSPLHDQPMIAVVRAAAELVFVPLTIGGGIKDTVDPDGTPRSALDVASAYFRAGADKVSIGSEAVYAVERMLAAGGEGDGTSAIETIAEAYGNQAVVVSVDPRKVYVDPETYDGPYTDELVYADPVDPLSQERRAWWYQCTVSGGREPRPLSVVQLAQGAEKLGAGELLLNSIDRDGTKAGYDHQLITLVKRSVRIPIVASSGAGCPEHFVDVFQETGAEAALAAGIFHRGEVQIQDVKAALREAGIQIRSTWIDGLDLCM